MTSSSQPHLSNLNVILLNPGPIINWLVPDQVHRVGATAGQVGCVGGIWRSCPTHHFQRLRPGSWPNAIHTPHQEDVRSPRKKAERGREWESVVHDE